TPHALAITPPTNGAPAVAMLFVRLIPASFAPRSWTRVSDARSVFHGRKKSGMYAPYSNAKSPSCAGPWTNASASCAPARLARPATIAGVAGRDLGRVITIATTTAVSAAPARRAAVAAGGSP